MRPGRVAALVIGCLVLLPGIGMLLGGGALGAAYAFARDGDGYFEETLDRLESETVAITAEDLALMVDPDAPDVLVDALEADLRLRATSAEGEDVFVGVARDRDVDAYLADVAHDEVVDLRDGDTPVYRDRGGSTDVPPPAEQDFWVAQASGAGTQELTWEVASGRWAVVVMNADASPGVAVDAEVGVRAGFLLPLAVILLVLGAVVTAVAVTLIVVGASGRRDRQQPTLPPTPGQAAPSVPGARAHGGGAAPSPVTLQARLDPELSRWQWLVKWFLAIPHFIVLTFLWIAFAVLTVVAGFAILFTGRYPRSIFDFNVGVLRWSWRVTYYAGTGGIGTDRYPPFGLDPEPDDVVALDVAYPERLSRGLVLVKWWLLAIPHYLIVWLLVGGWMRPFDLGDDGFLDLAGVGGLLGLLVLVTGIVLLFTGRYPPALFDLVVGLNRWIYRVAAYAALMTDEYPPFRLDQGGSEPAPVPHPPPPLAPHERRDDATRSEGR